MTSAIWLPNQVSASAPSAQPTAHTDSERQDAAFASLLTAEAPPCATATERDRLDSPQVVHAAGAARSCEGLGETRAAEFQETGLFGLMDDVALGDSEDREARPTQVAAGLNTGVSPLPQQILAPDIGAGHTSAPAAIQGDLHRPSPAPVPPTAHSRPQHAIADATRVTTQARGRPVSSPTERTALHRADQRAFWPASGQTSAVHVAIAAAEHGLSVFARVGRMEPTERARLRHAATLLLAEHGYRGATITLDADLAEAKGE